MKREDVIEKVRKLFRLSESDNPTEAQSAAAAAQRLISKYNLEQVELGETPEEIIQQDFKTGQGHKWKILLSGIVAKNFRCRCYWTSRRSCVRFVGHHADVEVAYETYKFLFVLCKKLANKADREERAASGHSNGAGNAFALGFVMGVEKELGKQCTALMVVTPKEVNEEYEKIRVEQGLKGMNNHYSYKASQDGTYSDGEFAGRSAIGKRSLEVMA